MARDVVTTTATLEEMLIIELLKIKNPGVKFKIKSKGSIIDVYCNCKPVNVSPTGEISPRVKGEPYWNFYGSWTPMEKKIVYRPTLEEELISCLLQEKNPDVYCKTKFCRDKLVGIYGYDGMELQIDAVGHIISSTHA